MPRQLEHSDTRSDTYDRGFRRGDSAIHRQQTNLSPESLRDSARRAGTGMPRQKWSGRLGLRHRRAPTRTAGASDTETVSVKHRKQTYLSPDSLRDSAYALRHVHNPTRARLRNFESKLLYPSVKPPAPSLVACMALGRSECPILPTCCRHPRTPPPPSLLVGGGLTPPAAWRRGTGGPSLNAHAWEKTITKSPQGGRYQARDDIQNHFII